MTEGKKFDDNKVRLDLVPPDALYAIADILTVGAVKYGDRNWEKGMRWGRVYAALLRHLFLWWSGNESDLETGRSHLHHAGCCIMFLISYECRSVGEDDRKKP